MDPNLDAHRIVDAGRADAPGAAVVEQTDPRPAIAATLLAVSAVATTTAGFLVDPAAGCLALGVWALLVGLAVAWNP